MKGLESLKLLQQMDQMSVQTDYLRLQMEQKQRIAAARADASGDIAPSFARGLTEGVREVTGEDTAAPVEVAPKTPQEATQRYIDRLKEIGEFEQAQAVEANDQRLRATTMELQQKQQEHSARTLFMATMLVESGQGPYGLQMAQSINPNIISMTPMKGGKVLVKTKQRPSGFILDKDKLLRAATSPSVIFSAQQAAIRERRRAQSTPLPAKATKQDVKVMVTTLPSYVEVDKRIPELGTAYQGAFSKDVLDLAAAMQAEAKRRGIVLDNATARYRAAKIASRGIHTDEQRIWGHPIWSSHSYRPMKKKDKQAAITEGVSTQLTSKQQELVDKADKVTGSEAHAHALARKAVAAGKPIAVINAILKRDGYKEIKP